MKFTFVVEVEVSRTEGKFATRDELADQILEALDDANPGDMTGENDGQYAVDSWDVNEQAQGKKK